MNFRSAVPALALLSGAVSRDRRAATRDSCPSSSRFPSGPRTLGPWRRRRHEPRRRGDFLQPGAARHRERLQHVRRALCRRLNGAALSAVTRFNGGGVAHRNAHANRRGRSFVSSPGTPADIRCKRWCPRSLELSVGIAQAFKGIRFGVAGKYAGPRIRRVAIRARSRRSRGLESDVRLVHRRRRGAEPRAGRGSAGSRSKPSFRDRRRSAFRAAARSASSISSAPPPSPGFAATRSRPRADSRSTTVG